MGSQKMSKDDVVTRLLLVKPSFDALVSGVAATRDWKCVLDVHNTLTVLKTRPGCLDPRAAKRFLTDVRLAFEEIAHKRAVYGDKTLTEQEQELMWGLYTAFEDVLTTLPLREIEAAEHETIRRLSRKENVTVLKEEKP